MTQSLLPVVVMLILLPAVSGVGQSRVLYDFEGDDAGEGWWAVNDGVMGGVSDGRYVISEEGDLTFLGNLSLENNGGFASIRARGDHLAMDADEAIVLRVRGDGRTYNFNLYTRENLGGYSYRQSFDTVEGEWAEVRLPLDGFVATWRGRVFPDEPFDPTAVKGLGVLLGDKTPGPFELDIDWIKAGPIADTASAEGDDQPRG